MEARAKSQRSIRRHLICGIATVALLAGGVGGLATTTELAGAVIAPGSLVVDTNVKKVQHPTGGVVGELRARDGDRVKAGDVLGHRAGEELDVLRQIADVLSKSLGIPLTEGRPVEAHLSPKRRPDPDEDARKGRFPRGAWADHAERVAGLQREGHVMHNDMLS